MAFMVSTDKEGLHYTVLNWETAERWHGDCCGGPRDFDWRGVERGRKIVVEYVHRPRHLPKVFHRRPDELYEVTFVRVKIEHDGGHEWHVPVFASTLNDRKQTTRVIGAFAFADDATAVHDLVQFKARQRATKALRHLFHTYADAVRKERQQEQRQQQQEQRDKELRELAAAAGLTYEDLVQAMETWNRMRRRRYGPNNCLCCGRLLTDPASIISGIGPECIKQFPAMIAAARAKVIDLGRMRFDADRLLARFQRAGMEDLAAIVREAKAHEELVTGQA